MIEFVADNEIYEKVILGPIPRAQNFVWLATADLKDLHVAKDGRGMVPFLEILADLVDSGVLVRLLHAKEPGPRFRTDFDRYPVLIDGMERILCPRVHFKCVVVDGQFAYSGSGNLTGAGMGAKSVDGRNFEHGIITDDRGLIGQIMKHFDSIWMGSRCDNCRRQEYCADYHELLFDQD